MSPTLRHITDSRRRATTSATHSWHTGALDEPDKLEHMPKRPRHHLFSAASRVARLGVVALVVIRDERTCVHVDAT